LPNSRLQEELKQSVPFASPAVEAYLNLMRTADRLRSAFQQLFKAHGISDPQYNVLRILRGAGPDGLPSLAVAERMVTRVPDITRLLDRLAGCELVVRERSDDDRRVVIARITTKGLGLLERLDEPLVECHARLMAHMSERELDDLNRLLVRAREGDGPCDDA